MARDCYDNCLAYLDECLGHLFQELERRGELDRTLVIVTADHGEILNEQRGYFDHHGLYEDIIRVPLVMRHPAIATVRLDQMVQHLDLAPRDEAGLGHGEAPGASQREARLSERKGNGGGALVAQVAQQHGARVGIQRWRRSNERHGASAAGGSGRGDHE